MNRILPNSLRWVAVVLLIGIGLWLLNLVVYHTWSADSFLSGTQEVSNWHQKWALIFLATALIVFVGAGAMVWRLVFRRRPTTS